MMALVLLLAATITAVPLGLLGKERERAGSQKFCEEVLEGYCATGEERGCGDRGKDGICASNSCPAGLGKLTWSISDKNFKHYESCQHPAVCCAGIILSGGCGATNCVIPSYPAIDALLKLLLYRARVDIEETVIGYKAVDKHGVVTGDDANHPKAAQTYVQFSWQGRTVTPVVKPFAQATAPPWNSGGQDFDWAPTDEFDGIKKYVDTNEAALKHVFGPSAVFLCKTAVDELGSIWKMTKGNLVSKMLMFIIQRGQALAGEEALVFYSWVKDGQQCANYNVETTGVDWGQLEAHAGGVGDHVWNQADAGLFNRLARWDQLVKETRDELQEIQDTQDYLSAKPTTTKDPTTNICNFYEWNKHLWGQMSVPAYLGQAAGWVQQVGVKWDEEQVLHFNKVMLLILYLNDLDVQAAIRVASGVRKRNPPGTDPITRAQLLTKYDDWAVAVIEAATEATKKLFPAQ